VRLPIQIPNFMQLGLMASSFSSRSAAPLDSVVQIEKDSDVPGERSASVSTSSVAEGPVHRLWITYG
jgi:hypothetical protein